MNKLYNTFKSILKKKPHISLIGFTNILLLFFLLFTAVQFVVSFKEMTFYDLRPRIIGARLLEAEINPYFYKWQNEDDNRFYDTGAYITQFKVSRTTSTPFMLYLHKGYSQLDFSLIGISWFLFQFGSFLFVFLIFYFRSDRPQIKLFVAIIACCFFISDGWQHHIESGQIYVIYPLLFTFLLLIYEKRNTYLLFLSGIIIGVSFFMWPTMVFFIIPFLLNKEYKMLLGALLGVVVILFTHFIPNYELWQSYFSAMKIWETFWFEIDDGLRQRLPYYINNSIQNITYFFFKIELTSIKLMIFFSFIVSIILLFLKKTITQLNVYNIFLLGALFVCLADFFLPAPRYSYYIIQWIFPLFIIAYNQEKTFNSINVLIFFGLFLIITPIPRLFSFNFLMGEILFTMAILLELRLNSLQNSKVFLQNLSN